jgi:hypothetical protein
MNNYQTFNLWTTQIQVIDNFVTDSLLYEKLKFESSIAKTIEGQDINNMTPSQSELFKSVSLIVRMYCLENNINYNNLQINDLQKGYLHKYDQSMVGNHLYEPHHDIAEGSYITAIYYIDSSYREDHWVGGELTLYKHLTFADYPDNTINILPKQNRLIVFPGFTTHRVKPYFGDIPRTSLVFGWSVIDGELKKHLIV